MDQTFSVWCPLKGHTYLNSDNRSKYANKAQERNASDKFLVIFNFYVSEESGHCVAMTFLFSIFFSFSASVQRVNESKCLDFRVVFELYSLINYKQKPFEKQTLKGSSFWFGCVIHANLPFLTYPIFILRTDRAGCCFSPSYILEDQKSFQAHGMWKAQTFR